LKRSKVATKASDRSLLLRRLKLHEGNWLRIPHHPATQSTLIWPGIPRPSGHLFHGHPAGQSERSNLDHCD